MASKTATNKTERTIPILPAETVTTVPIIWNQRRTAQYLGVSEKWLERDRWAGATIPYVKVGRAVRYRACDVVEYIEQQRNKAVSQ